LLGYAKGNCDEDEYGSRKVRKKLSVPKRRELKFIFDGVVGGRFVVRRECISLLQ